MREDPYGDPNRTRIVDGENRIGSASDQPIAAVATFDGGSKAR